MTLDDFDNRMKDLLEEAAESGIRVDRVSNEYLETLGGQLTLLSTEYDLRKL